LETDFWPLTFYFPIARITALEKGILLLCIERRAEFVTFEGAFRLNKD
jgi:hypothetical protein